MCQKYNLNKQHILIKLELIVILGHFSSEMSKCLVPLKKPQRILISSNCLCLLFDTLKYTFKVYSTRFDHRGSKSCDFT